MKLRRRHATKKSQYITKKDGRLIRKAIFRTIQIQMLAIFRKVTVSTFTHESRLVYATYSFGYARSAWTKYMTPAPPPTNTSNNTQQPDCAKA